jgi:hypothetical protein
MSTEAANAAPRVGECTDDMFDDHGGKNIANPESIANAENGIPVQPNSPSKQPASPQPARRETIPKRPVTPYVTRRGRSVMPPKRLDL